MRLGVGRWLWDGDDAVGLAIIDGALRGWLFRMAECEAAVARERSALDVFRAQCGAFMRAAHGDLAGCHVNITRDECLAGGCEVAVLFYACLRLVAYLDSEGIRMAIVLRDGRVVRQRLVNSMEVRVDRYRLRLARKASRRWLRRVEEYT